MPRLWLTRTQPFADESAARLRAMGHEVIVAPLLETVILPLPQNLPDPEALLIFTSRKAVIVFCVSITDRHFECICVGDATADTARSAGFKSVHSAQGNAGDVTRWIKENISFDRPIYHAASAHPRGDIIETLIEAGFTRALRETFYTTESVTCDPRSEPRDDDMILLYSPMAAACLVSLNIDFMAAETLSFSPSVDSILEKSRLSFKARHISSRPTEVSLFNHLL